MRPGGGSGGRVYDLDSLVDFEKGERTYTQLWRTPYSEAYAIGWKQAGDTGFHDHDGSVGAVHVVRGTVAEEHIVLRPAGDWLARVEFTCGETFRFDGAHIHRMRHAAGDIALTVHVYSPPLGARAPTSSPATARCAAGASTPTRSCARATRSRSTAPSRILRSSELQAASRSSTHTGGSPRSSLQTRISAVPTGSNGSRCASSAGTTRAAGPGRQALRPKALLRRASTT